MLNTNRPDDTRCPADAHMIECRTPFASQPAGVCPTCQLGTCSGCGAPMTPEQCATSRTECPVAARNEVYCPVCLREVCEGPGETGEEETVETRTLSDSELLALKMEVA